MTQPRHYSAPQSHADYDDWHRQVSREDEAASPLHDPWYASIYPRISKTPGTPNVLEVGCGRGGFAVWLAKRHPTWQITGLDFSVAAIELARRTAQSANSSAKFVTGNAEALPFPDHSVDLLISCECMEHVPHPPVMAREIARVLKPGGCYCLTTENYLNGMLLAWLQTWLINTPFNSGSGIQPRENFFIFWMVRRWLREAGLTIDAMDSNHFQWLLLPRVDPAKLCTKTIDNPFAKRLAQPFGRHFSFFGHKPGH